MISRRVSWNKRLISTKKRVAGSSPTPKLGPVDFCFLSAGRRRPYPNQWGGAQESDPMTSGTTRHHVCSGYNLSAILVKTKNVKFSDIEWSGKFEKGKMGNNAGKVCVGGVTCYLVRVYPLQHQQVVRRGRSGAKRVYRKAEVLTRVLF